MGNVAIAPFVRGATSCPDSGAVARRRVAGLESTAVGGSSSKTGVGGRGLSAMLGVLEVRTAIV